MQIILLERVPNLGQIGDEVSVRDGYARNFLLPRKMALRATEANRSRFEAQRKDIEARNLERRKDAEGVAKTLEGASCTIIRQAGESGQLYGSVSARDIAEALDVAGYKVDRHQIVLHRPIKSTGVQQIEVRLHPEVLVTVSVNVARSAAEASEQEADGFFESDASSESEEGAREALDDDEAAGDEGDGEGLND